MAAITLKQYNAIRKAAVGYKGTRAQLAAEHGVSERTLRKILAAETWKEYREKNVVTSRKAQAAQKAKKQAAESIPPWEDSGQALEDDLVIQDPDKPVVTGPVAADPCQLSPEVCWWIRKACGFGSNGEIRGLIGALACYSPDHFTEHMALLNDSLSRNKCRE